MKERKLVLDIITIVANFLASLVFLTPVWYFSSNVNINGVDSILTKYTIRVFDYAKLREVKEIYESYGKDIDLRLSLVFHIMAAFTMLFSFLFIVLTILSATNLLKQFKITPKIISIIISVCSLSSLAIAIIFTYNSYEIINNSEDVTYSLSINMSTGIYLFIIFELMGGICAYIASSLKDGEY